MKRNNLVMIIFSVVLALFFWTYTCINISTFTTHADGEVFYLNFFLTSLVSSALMCFLGVTKFRMNKIFELIFGVLAFVVAAFGAMEISVILSGGFHSSWFVYLSNMLIYLSVGMAGMIIFGSLRACGIFTLLSSFLFNGISFIIYMFRGSPLSPSDIFAWGTAMNVASQYDFRPEYQLITAVTLATALIFVVCKFPIRIKFRLSSIVMRAVGAIALGGIVTFINFADYSKLDVSEYDQYYANINFGSALSFYINSDKMQLVKNEDYNPDKLNEKLLSYRQEGAILSESGKSENTVLKSVTSSDSKRPNIIVIMNESYCDFNVINEFKTDVDYMSYYKSLKTDTVKGHLLVSPFGGYTCNTEYEFLTGMSTGVLNSRSAPYLQMIFNNLPYSLNTHMKKLGYRATAIHPFYADSWNRTAVYDYLGFDEFISLENLDKYSEYPERLRGYISDKGNYGTILNMLSKDDSEKREFIFNITIQNHGGYNFDKFPSEVHIKGMNGSYPETEQYLTLMKHSDEALKYFINALKKYDEPVLLLMFGDHMPNVERGFYEELYGKSLDNISYDEAMKRYIVPFVMWANYDIEEKTDVKTSPCYLSNMLMDAAKLPKSRIQMYLDELKNDIVQLNPMGYYDAQGKRHAISESAKLDEYYDLQYALLKGENLSYDYKIENEPLPMFGSIPISAKFIFR